MLEKDFQRKFIEQATLRGWRAKKVYWTIKGYPDLLIWNPKYQGKMVFVELKVKTYLTILQKMKIKELKDDGFKVFVIRYKEGYTFKRKKRKSPLNP